MRERRRDSRGCEGGCFARPQEGSMSVFDVTATERADVTPAMAVDHCRRAPATGWASAGAGR
jgi:hypothetical protein